MQSNKDNKHPPPPEHSSSLKKIYLVAYNVSLVVAWSLVFLKSLVFITEKHTFVGLYDETQYWLKIAQTAAIMEIFHSLFGLVRSSVMTSLLQVCSRLFALWVIVVPLVMQDGGERDTIGFPLLLFAWTITEIIRYAFYANTLLDTMINSLQWCRYTFFIVLYPMGVAGELICVMAALPLARNTGAFSITLPNIFNFSFDFVYACYIIMLMYAPGFYYLYTYMLYQRKKVLGAKTKSQ